MSSESVKVVVRHLPKYMTEHEILEQISPLPEEVTGVSFRPANHAFDHFSYATLTLNFSEYCDSLIDFESRFNGYIFVDSRGNDSAAIVEAAVNQKFHPCDRARLKEDSRVGAVLNDTYYLEFCKKLEEEKAIPVMTLEQQIKKLNRPDDARTRPFTEIDRMETPLVKYFFEKELGKQRDYGARKARREEKRAAAKQNASKNIMDILMKPAASAAAASTSSAAPKRADDVADREKEKRAKIDAKRKERDALRKKKFLEEKKRKREERELEQPNQPREYPKKKERAPKPPRPTPAKTLGEQQGEDWIKKLTDPKATIKKKHDVVSAKLTSPVAVHQRSAPATSTLDSSHLPTSLPRVTAEKPAATVTPRRTRPRSGPKNETTAMLP
uniref:Smg4_UPF3 domain-containing protein n=1 Tax=Caenorhabditis japonica TaxID=281687 RepID=A0A8R1E0W3_CAEJA